jgi:hypothetical protein
MPAQNQSMLDVCESILKTPRKPVWHPQVGTVRLQLEVRLLLHRPLVVIIVLNGFSQRA